MQLPRPNEPANPPAAHPSTTSGFTGLVIESLENNLELFTVDGCPAVVHRSWEQPEGEKTGILELLFSLEKPTRFSVAIKVPEYCLNACMTLNNQALLSWFSNILPDRLPAMPVNACSGEVSHETPLKPGQLQTLNFCWHDGDRLRMFVVFGG